MWFSFHIACKRYASLARVFIFTLRVHASCTGKIRQRDIRQTDIGQRDIGQVCTALYFTGFDQCFLYVHNSERVVRRSCTLINPLSKNCSTDNRSHLADVCCAGVVGDSYYTYSWNIMNTQKMKTFVYKNWYDAVFLSLVTRLDIWTKKNKRNTN